MVKESCVRTFQSSKTNFPLYTQWRPVPNRKSSKQRFRICLVTLLRSSATANLLFREKGIAATRQLAKRQLTWLRGMKDRIVVDCLGDRPAELVIAAPVAEAPSAAPSVAPAAASPAVGAGRVARPMPRWTAAQVDRLRELYPEHDNLAVAKALGRTVTGVANKANQLGLKKSSALLATIGRQNVGLRYRRDERAGVLVPAVLVRPLPTAHPGGAAAAAARG
jgi:hypothetical protein